MITKTLLLVAGLCALARSQAPNTLGACESREGFKLLFDGTLAGFQQNWVNYKQGSDVNTDFDAKWTLCPDVQAICTKATASNTLRSREKFGDFDLRLEYRNDGDAGVFYRGLTRGANLNATAVEYGLMNDPTGLAKEEWAGSLNALIAPNPYTYKPYSTLEWTSVRIIAIADSVEHWMNGVKVLGYRFWGAAWNAGYDKSKYATSKDKAQLTSGCKCMIPSGYFGLQGDHPTTWNLRNIRVNTGSAVHFGPPECGVSGTVKAGRPAAPALRILDGRLGLAGAAGRADILSLDGRREANVVFAQGTAPLPRLRPGLHLLKRGASPALKFLAP